MCHRERDPFLIFQKVERNLWDHAIDLRGNRILVAVSAGPDSTFLMHFLNWLRARVCLDLIVGHIEHGMRPEDDPLETSFLRDAASSLGLTLSVAKVDPSILNKKGSLEERLREERYRLLKAMAREFKCGLIALGHQMDDQAETLLMRLLRGSGVRGLSSMKVKEGEFIRPLLCLTREEILAFLEAQKIAYVKDPSNRDSRYLRNWIRLELLPVLKRVQPRIIHVLGRTAKTLSTEVDYYEEKGIEWLNSHGMTQGGEIWVPITKLVEEHVALQAHIIMMMFLRVRGSLKGLNRAHIEQVIRLLRKPEGGKRITLPGGYELCVNPSLLVLRKSSPELREYPPMEIPGPGTYRLWDLPLSLEVSILEARPKDLEGGSDSAFLDVKKASFPLKVRTFLPGDWFYPLGMVGRKKLQDFFVNQKIPKDERGRIPLVLSGERIVWVGGFRIDHHFRVTEETESTLFLLLKREGPI